MSRITISASTALPPAFTARERATLDTYFGHAAAARSTRKRNAIAVAMAATAISISALLGMLAPAHAQGSSDMIRSGVNATAASFISFGSGAVVQVYKSDGSVQCGGTASGVSLAGMATELTHAGVRVIAMRKGNDGLLHPDICGAPDGVLNVYEIDARGLRVAEGLGFAILTAPGH